MSDYGGIILAAGKGDRMHPLSLDYPKPLLPVLNRPILEHQIESMRLAGITDCVIVCGHLRQHLTDVIGDGSRLGVKVRYVQQDKPLGIAHALSRAEPYVEKPFVLFLGDIFLGELDLGQMISTFEGRVAGAVLGVREERVEEYLRRNFAVVLHESGMVRRVIEKPRHARTMLKGLGLYFFDLHVFDAVRRTPRTAMRDEYEITSSIQILIDDGYPVYPCPMSGWDMNITTIQDLWECNFRLLGSASTPTIVGQNLNCPAGTRVENSIIGDNVLIRHPIRLSNALVLSDSRIDSDKDLANVVIHKEDVYPVHTHR